MAKTAGKKDIKPLTSAEEAAWRALIGAVLVIPRLLEGDLLEAHGLNPSEYSVLQHLSEAPERSLRMNELANYVSLSGSGLTRVVERLSRQGLVERVRAESDGRGQSAVLTPAGLQRLQEAWPTHLASVRRHVLDHLAGLDLGAFADAVGRIADADLGPPISLRRGQRAQ
jgi:DNA-binding MarR family transcriptional regulator